jgi:hypothetical protein
LSGPLLVGGKTGQNEISPVGPLHHDGSHQQMQLRLGISRVITVTEKHQPKPLVAFGANFPVRQLIPELACGFFDVRRFNERSLCVLCLCCDIL